MRRAAALFLDNLDDLARSLGWGRHPLRVLLWVALALPAALFTWRLLRFDRMLGLGGTRFAARRALQWFYRGVCVVTDVPSFDTGGLVVSNHPGLGDSLALMAVLPQDRYRLVANDRVFFRCLPNVLERLILVPADPTERHRVVGAILEAVGRGELVVLYPAGSIEPDPAFRRWGWISPEVPLLGEWSGVVALVARRLKRGGGRIYPVLVSDVFSQRSVCSWWSAMGRTREERERRAVGYQLLRGLGRDTEVRVAFAPPLQSDFLETWPPKEWTGRLRDVCSALASVLLWS